VRNEFVFRIMSEEVQLTLVDDLSNVFPIETRLINHFRKSENSKLTSLYPDPISKCFIGPGNNAEL
jgi:hypothetical protein